MQQQNPLENRNLLLAIVLSALVLLGFDYFFGPKHFPETQPAAVVTDATPSLTPEAPAMAAQPLVMPNAQVPTNARVAIINDVADASIALTGARLDSLTLKQFTNSLEDQTPVQLLIPQGDKARYVDMGWLGNGLNLPGAVSPWQVASQKDNMVVLTWTNGQQNFTRTFVYDPASYIFTVTDRIDNKADAPIQVAHYAQVVKAGGDEPGSSWYNFHGPQAFMAGQHHTINPHELNEDGPQEFTGTDGWIGISTRYFMSALLPQVDENRQVQFRFTPDGAAGFTTVSFRSDAKTIAPHMAEQVTYRVFTGPMSHAALKTAGQGLEHAIDYGWYHIIAAALFHAMDWMQQFVHNWGIAIILMTVLLKLLTYPLANKSYIAMGKMRLLVPEMERLRERYGDNRNQLAMEMMALYKKHNVSPASGCWPMLIQIPIFFAFYKVILISFEFRQAPFFGWIHDLSEQDPYFVLPVLMAITMIIQQRLNPPATDPVQQKVMTWMPIIFSIFFLWLPSGLVLYWFVNNLLSIIQQAAINRRMEKLGLKPVRQK